ncbi:MAG TPA: chorismate lyase [Gammaproteobacteria bacterium]|nr:chorismate lyase [Gammaproteobacteria bacterium]
MANWQTPEQIPPSKRPPDELWRRLTENGSLTNHLRQQYGNSIGVRLLRETTITNNADQTLPPAMPPQQNLFCREVIIHHDTTPLVFARTLVQLSALENKQHWLLQQGENPLGDTLFSQDETQRRNLEVKHLTTKDALYKDAAKQVTDNYRPSWARRSVIYSNGLALLIVECFYEQL